ncbi:SsgA family sporulation/cell division regulator [Streptomyces sp. NPDC006544]|uniref:SsgA family sporulation/cell division regulator n=1 Tax=Streptomyces sp. NPDC006544 TaxID=3154583 RepID=UPI0033ADAFD1
MSCVSALIVVRLEAATDHVLLLARLSYDGEDPYAVQAEFFDGPDVLARWHFDRQMLAEGLRRPVGEGDVGFSPYTDAGADELRIDLRGPSTEPEGNATLFVDTRVLTCFLEQTFAVIGMGEEFLDLDTLLDELLARG